jgi:PKD repeat protein
MKLSRHRLVTLLILTLIASSALASLPPSQAGEPAGDSLMRLVCVGLLPSTTDCVSDTLQPFESLIYDTNGNSLYDSGEFAIVGPIPLLGAPLTDDAKIRYRDSTAPSGEWNAGDTIFYDRDGTTISRVTLLGNPTTSSVSILDDPLIKFADSNSNGVLDGVVKVTARLENLGGTMIDVTQEDVDAIQTVFTYDPTVLGVMRRSYPTGTLIFGGSFSGAVDNHCQNSGGTPLDTIVPDEASGTISASHLCTESGGRTTDVGIGCDPNTSAAFCPGDGSGLPLQNLDILNIQFMILSHGSFPLAQVVEEPGIPGSKITDIDGTTPTVLPLSLVNTTFDNRKPGSNEPPTAQFTISPSKATVGESATFDGTTSSDPDGTIVSYSWDFGDGGIDTGPIASHTYNTPGVFTVTLTVVDNLNADGTAQQSIQVNPPPQNNPPVPIVTVTPQYPLINEAVTFDATASYDPDPGDTIQSYEWSFGDGTTGSGATVTHTYTSPAYYIVVLTVTDNRGLPNSVFRPVFVTRIPYVPGVHVGDWAAYTASGNVPGISEILLATINVTSVEGSNLTLVTTLLSFNGTISYQNMTQDIRTFNFLIMASNLMAGDIPWIGPPFVINSTITGTFVGATRSANIISYSQFGATVLGQWDQLSGLLLFYNATFPDPLSGYVTITMVDTNIWQPTENRMPVPVFNWNPAMPNVGQTVSFDASRSYDPDTGDSITSYTWEFGDGQSEVSTAPSVTHVYSAEGNYTVVLTVRDTQGATASSRRTIAVGVVPEHDVAIIQVTTSTTSAIIGQAVTINVTVSNPGTFTETTVVTVVGGTITIGSETLTLEAGTTNVISITWDTTGLAAGPYLIVASASPVPGETSLDNNMFQDGTVTLTLPLSVTISANPQRGVFPLSVTFTSGVTGGTPPYTFFWEFRDSTTSTSQNPTHVYTTPGTFVARLTITDSASVTQSTTITVTVLSQLVATMTASPATGTAPLTVSFTASASGGQPSYTFAWVFGDGGTGSGTTVSHTYQSQGTFTATVTVTDSDGRTAQRPTTITVSAPTTGSLRIIVRDTEGNPISGATVSFTSVPEGQTRPPAKVTLSDGSVLFTGLRPGEYAYNVTAGGFQAEAKTVTVTAGTTAVESPVALSAALRTATGPNYPLYAGVGAAIVLILVGALLYLRKRTPATSKQ